MLDQLTTGIDVVGWIMGIWGLLHPLLASRATLFAQSAELRARADER